MQLRTDAGVRGMRVSTAVSVLGALALMAATVGAVVETRAGAQPPARTFPTIDGHVFEVKPRARPSSPFAAGGRVFHQKFGYGTVLAVDNDKLEIMFDQAGSKKVMDSFVVAAEKAG